jgi:hypothetical protein
MIPIAIPVNKLLGHFVGGFRVLDANGIGTDEVLWCETPVRLTRAAAIADALMTLRAE